MIKVMITRAFMFSIKNSYLKQSLHNDFRNFRISRWPVGKMSRCQFPSVSRQGDPKNRSAVVPFLGKLFGNVRFPCGFLYVYLRKLEVYMWFPLCLHGNPEVSTWFPLCLHWETWFPVVSLMFPFGNRGLHVVSPYLPYGETTSWPEYPCDGSI